MRFTRTPARRRTWGIDPRTLLLRVGRHRLVGGQEDMIVDIAWTTTFSG
ncbi:hypothetical protein [Nocardia sp. CA-120079]